MDRRLITIFSFLSAINVAFMGAFAQTHQVSGAVIAKGIPVAYASIVLSQDSLITKTKFSDEEGCFLIEEVAPGKYLLKVSAVGYQALEMAVEISGATDVGILQLQEDSALLDEVVVTAARKLLDRQADRFVMDVSAGSFQTSSLLEIFMAAPFMQVKGDDIAINGKRNILVLLDNVPVPGATLKQVLNTMNGNEIDKIEFITIPGARYDASVDAVIHIHTKRALAQGITGSVNGTYSQGDQARGNMGLNLTYRKDRWTLNGRYGFNRSNLVTTIHNNREFTLPSGNLAIGGPNSEFYDTRLHNASISVGFNINEFHQLTVTGHIVKDDTPNGRMASNLGFSSAIGHAADSSLMAEINTENSNSFENYSFNYVGKLDSSGTQTELIVIYTPVGSSRYRVVSRQDIFLPDGILESTFPSIRNENRSTGHIVVLQSDWQLPFDNQWRLEAGVRFNSSRNDADINQSEYRDGTWLPMSDYTFTNRFREDIVAGYVAAQKRWAGTQVRVGIRVENTDMGVEGVYDRRFFDFFPNAGIQQEIIGNRVISFNYRRSIARPGFGQMTPFRTYLNAYELFEGNPNLRPSYSQTFTINGDVSKNVFLELAYLQYRDRTMQLPRQEGLVSVWTPLSMDGSEWSANLSYLYKIASWWDANSYIRGFRYAYEGPLNNDYVDESGYSYNVGLTSTVRFPAGFTLDATYNYYAPSGYAGWYDFSSNFARLAIRKNMLGKRGQLVLAFNDIFKGQRYRSELQAGNLYVYNVNYNDTQRVSLGFVFNFGKSTVKMAERKKLGNEDIINRAN
ncbi:outer membrane beta-barrel protein [Parapedobacter koreensis]|nr:outer membrane beta-barrel protein [Parapedobacter koreensis]